MNREDSAKVGGWLDHASKMARTVAGHNAEETIAALTVERDNALAAIRRRSSQRDQLDERCEELIDQRDRATARAERAEATIERVRALANRRVISPDAYLAILDSTDPVEAAPEENVCPTCGPTSLERHPRLPVMRCSNCKEHVRSDFALPVDGETT